MLAGFVAFTLAACGPSDAEPEAPADPDAEWAEHALAAMGRSDEASRYANVESAEMMGDGVSRGPENGAAILVRELQTLHNARDTAARLGAAVAAQQIARLIDTLSG